MNDVRLCHFNREGRCWGVDDVMEADHDDNTQWWTCEGHAPCWDYHSDHLPILDLRRYDGSKFRRRDVFVTILEAFQGWERDDDGRLRADRGRYRLLVQSVQTDVDEFSVEAEVSGFGTCQSWTWFCRTDDAAWLAAAAWAEGVAAAADWEAPGV